MKIFFAAAAPYELAKSWADSLPEEKAARVARMRRETDRALALTAHRLLCLALKAEYGIAPAPTDIGLEPHGKPYLTAHPDIHFSISHSGNMAMCAVNDAPVGADIEMARKVTNGVSERIMSAAESRAYQSTTDKQSLFFQIWTLKEAYVKYCGMGLGIPLNSVTVCPSSGGSVLTDTGCEFWMAQPAPGYQAAVCAKSVAVPGMVIVDLQQLSV